MDAVRRARSMEALRHDLRVASPEDQSRHPTGVVYREGNGRIHDLVSKFRLGFGENIEHRMVIGISGTLLPTKVSTLKQGKDYDCQSHCMRVMFYMRARRAGLDCSIQVKPECLCIKLTKEG